eukprot:gene12278-12364_t
MSLAPELDMKLMPNRNQINLAISRGTFRSGFREHFPEISAVVLVLAAATLAWLIVEYRRTVDLVSHSVEVESSILEVFAAVHDAESGSRGYVLTGNELFLQRYSEAENNVEAKIQKLRHLTADNAAQQLTYTDLQIAIEESFSGFKQGIKLRQKLGIDAAVAFIRSDDEYNALERIRTDITRMTLVEANLSHDRIVNVQNVTLAGGIIASLALLVVIGSMMAWIHNTRREARALLTTLIDREKKEEQIRHMQKIEAVGQLSGGLAHDLNNMLAVIMSGLTLTEKRLAAGDTNVLRFINAAMDGATRAATLTSRLMAFSRQLPLAPKPIDVNKLISGLSDLMERTLGETTKSKIILNAHLWNALADASQLENAVINLAINARDAMPDGGDLIIETINFEFDAKGAKDNDVPIGKYVQISVSDTGMGMTQEVINKAFDPFFTTKGVGKGTGLGLSQVYGFVKQSGGHIKIYSELNHGTTVKMYLPRLERKMTRQEMTTESVKNYIPQRRDNSANVILVVEDDARVREMSVSSLRELGYTVVHADGAKSALEKLDELPLPTILFTDIVMPDVNGRQLAAEVTLRRPDMKILYTTGFTRDAIIHGGQLDAGLNFITKPFTLAQIAEKMNEVLADVA